MKRLFIIIPILAVLGCAAYNQGINQKKEANGSICVKTEHIGNSDIVDYLEYKSYNYEVADAERQNKLSMGTKEDLDDAISKLSLGGIINISFECPTIESATPENFEYLIQDTSGNVLFRHKGFDRPTPKFIIRSDNSVEWLSSDAMGLESKIPSPFKVSVISTLFNTRSTYIVYPDKTGLPEK